MLTGFTPNSAERVVHNPVPEAMHPVDDAGRTCDAHFPGLE
jgi:hypothetical protein